MRSFTQFLAMVLMATFSMTALAQGLMDEEEPSEGDAAAANSFVDDEIPIKKKTDADAAPADADAPAADKDPNAPRAEMVMDGEVVADQPGSEKKAQGTDFIGLAPTKAWNDRNGFGVSLGIGGLTCSRDYCDNTLDVKIFGSVSGTVGGYYRLNPNLSFFGEATFALVNTNFNQIATGDVTADSDKAFAFSFIAGAAFHIPVKGWLDLYASAGLGPALLRAKAESNGNAFTHRWAGLDIEIGFGADFYFWSVGPMKNFSIGPYMRVGFPIWFKLCADAAGDGNEVCDMPRNHSANSDYAWKSEPIMFHTGFEAKLDFGKTIGGSAKSKEDSDDGASFGVSAEASAGTDKAEETPAEAPAEEAPAEESEEIDPASLF